MGVVALLRSCEKSDIDKLRAQTDRITLLPVLAGYSKIHYRRKKNSQVGGKLHFLIKR